MSNSIDIKGLDLDDFVTENLKLTAQILHEEGAHLRINLLLDKVIFTRVEIHSTIGSVEIRLWDPETWEKKYPSQTITYKKD